MRITYIQVKFPETPISVKCLQNISIHHFWVNKASGTRWWRSFLPQTSVLRNNYVLSPDRKSELFAQIIDDMGLILKDIFIQTWPRSFEVISGHSKSKKNLKISKFLYFFENFFLNKTTKIGNLSRKHLRIENYFRISLIYSESFSNKNYGSQSKLGNFGLGTKNHKHLQEPSGSYISI